MIVRIITGGGGFVGSAVATYLSNVPGRLLLVENRPVQSPPGAELVRCDCRSREFATLLTKVLPGAERAELFAMAGNIGSRSTIRDTELSDFYEALDNNLAPAYAAARAFADAASQAGVPGSITFAGSVGAVRAHRYQAGYDAAKAAVESLARSFALEYAPSGLATRVVQLGPIAQSATTREDGERASALVRLVPRGRYASVDELAEAIVLFAGPAFDAATGATLPLDGGLIQQLRPVDIERPPTGAPAANPADGGRTGIGRIDADHTRAANSTSDDTFGFVRPDASRGYFPC
jgi:Dehydrogenases with different specificities (related to short-chain alcohol dehydrogenases)